jgi:hypothetical protein
MLRHVPRLAVLPVLVGMSQFEQQGNIKCFFKLQKSAAETLVGLSAVYGDKALKESGDWVSFLTFAFCEKLCLNSRKFLILPCAWYG